VTHQENPTHGIQTVSNQKLRLTANIVPITEVKEQQKGNDQ